MKSLQKIKDKVGELLYGGLSPDKISAAIATGIVVGLFPLLGTTSLLCLALGKIFKLNHLLLQAVNQIVYPLQLLLLIPLIQLGRIVLGQGVTDISLNKLSDSEMWTDISFYTGLALQQLYAVFIWALLAVPLYLLISKLSRQSITLWSEK